LIRKNLNVALTNSPKINHLKPIIAKVDNDDPALFEATLEIAKRFDLSEDDLEKFGKSFIDPEQEGESPILEVGKLMGNTEDEIRKYGETQTPSDRNSEDEPPILEIAKLMGNTEEDIKRFGGIQ
jgi:hypothetical protein